MDKVEIIENGKVNVVDYKTGKIKSRNELESKTKNADGNYKRQLIFYKLLLDNYKKGEWKMATGNIDFLTPDEKGKIKREIFVVSDEEVYELKKTIKDVANKILNLEFTNCTDEKCEWCKLAGTIK